jgi:hypothetical protein
MPANAIAGLMADQRAADEPVPARAALRWADHPRAVSAADQLADCGHEAKLIAQQRVTTCSDAS